MLRVLLIATLAFFISCQSRRYESLSSSDPSEDGVLSMQFSTVPGAEWDSITLSEICFGEENPKITMEECDGKSLIPYQVLKSSDVVEIPIRKGRYSARIVFKNIINFQRQTVAHVVRFSQKRNGNGCQPGFDSEAPGPLLEPIYFNYTDCSELQIFPRIKTKINLVITDKVESFFWGALWYKLISSGLGGLQFSHRYSRLEITYSPDVIRKP
ncbi:hypothetical protein EHQ61_12900 [Leptospira wolffii]|uniref:hypothetical protein n=1 Tax=Leptospira wolffii TaxID=409998 RepID=UPI0010831229|nr:hypothetical protein [Leptospira wolffii]TGL49343.1 hypothetical protein EHQ61_12900 [Leptospira wolffii]